MQAKKSYDHFVQFPLSFESFRYFSKIFFILSKKKKKIFFILMLCSIYLDKIFSYFAFRICFPFILILWIRLITQNHFNFLIQCLRSCYPLKMVKIGESILSFFNASSEFLIWGIGRFRGDYIFNNVLIFYFEI